MVRLTGQTLEEAGFFIIPSLEEGSKAVDIAGDIHLGIGEVQSGKLLAHGA